MFAVSEVGRIAVLSAGFCSQRGQRKQENGPVRVDFEAHRRDASLWGIFEDSSQGVGGAAERGRLAV